MLRLTKGSWGIVLLIGLLACTEDLTTPGYCPQTCPGGVVQVKDTVLDAVFDLDSAYSGYVFAGDGSGLLVSTLGPTDQYLTTIRFGVRPDSIRVGDSTYAYTIDSVVICFGVLAKNPAATGIVLQLHRAPATVDSGVTYADVASYVTPPRSSTRSWCRTRSRTGVSGRSFRGPTSSTWTSRPRTAGSWRSPSG